MAKPHESCDKMGNDVFYENDVAGLELRVRNENLFFLFLIQNICCGY